ncbi:evbL [soil metagenome]
MSTEPVANDEMSTAQIAAALADPIGDLGGRFMLSGRTYGKGAELGFSGLDFYFCGRGGVLGPVDASVLIHELGFFEPGNVRTQWEAGLDVMSPEAAAEQFMACGYAWGRARLPQDLPAGRLGELALAVVEATAQDQPVLFQAWAEFPWPDDDIDRGMHAIHLLRELRGGQHVRAAHQVGLDPHEAVVFRTGDANADLFGWSAPHPDPSACEVTWQVAEDATNEASAASLSTLDHEEQLELLTLARLAVPS